MKDVGTYLRLTPALRAVLTHLLTCGVDTWGLQVMKATGRPTGTVYPILARLEREGFVTSRWQDEPTVPGPRRRLYAITSTGRGWAETRLATPSSDTKGGLTSD